MSSGAQEKPKLFLATTAIEEFWDTSKPILFLGDWCLRYSRRAMWKQLKGEVVNGMWKESEKIHDAYRYVSEVYEKVLPSLAQALNNIHGVNYSNRYWRIVIGPWLFHYVHLLYDRYISLRLVLDNYPEFTTYGLAEKNFIVPTNTLDAYNLFMDDPYNLQVYTKILSALGKDFPCKNYQLAAEQIVSPKNTTKRLFLHKIAKLFQNNRGIIYSVPYFDRLIEFKILALTLGKVWPNFTIKFPQPLLPVNAQMRMKLHELLPSDDEFTGVLKRVLPTDMPQSHLEAYHQISREICANYPIAPKAIFSAVSWYFDEPFKQWAAFSAENGTKLMGIQHGGNYGSLLFMVAEEHELAITDKYYSWGWNCSDCASKVAPMPATKLAARKLIGASNDKKGILFVGTSAPRYIHRFQYLSNSQIPDYLQWQLRFIETISPEMRNKLRARIYQYDYGWDIRQRIEDAFPELHIESWQIPFLESLGNCRLCVCDHLSTTFAEALAANKPAILFWGQLVYQFREEAKPYYDALHSVGILHYSPEDAARTVNTVYDDIETWWNEPTRQSARQFFCDRFAKISANPVKEWVSEFKRTAYTLENH